MTVTEQEKTDMVRVSEGLAEAALAGEVRACATVILKPNGQIIYSKVGFASDIEAIGILEIVATRMRLPLLR